VPAPVMVLILDLACHCADVSNGGNPKAQALAPLL
jgi:hypothetical protein